MFQVGQRGLIRENRRRLMCLSMFWHFLDVVWIGVFTFVYLMGVHADEHHAQPRRTPTSRPTATRRPTAHGAAT